MSVVVSRKEAYALKVFRTSPCAEDIKAVLLRELNLERELFESEPVNEDTRKKIIAYKVALGVLFDEDLVKEQE